MFDYRDSIRIDVIGAESRQALLERTGISEHPTVADFSRFLYHLNLVYEISRLATDRGYRRFRFPRKTFRPVLSRLHPVDRMILSRVQYNSPWQLSVSLYDLGTQLAGGLGALWLFVQCLDRISTISLNRRKVRAEINKLELEAAKLKKELAAAEQVPRQAALAANPVDETKTRTISTGLQAEGNLEPLASSGPLLLPPNESQRLYNALRKRGAKRFYERNTEAIIRLGFQVEDLSIVVDQTREKLDG